MTFEEILDQAIAMLQRRGHLTYGTLKRQFQLDDAVLEDLKSACHPYARETSPRGGNGLRIMSSIQCLPRRLSTRSA
jgi:hypothetical protein